MKISFIVPIYNIKHLLIDSKLRCFESILNLETSIEYELIAVDDCSPDNSYEDVLLGYQHKYQDKFKAVLNSENHRAGGARNKGISIAQGEWIAFVDQDDWIDEHFVDKLLGMGETTGADMVGCYWNVKKKLDNSIERIVYVGYQEQVGILDKDKYAKLILEPGGLLSKIFRREVIERASIGGKLFPEDMMYEDNAVASSVMLAAKHYEFVPEPLYFYCSAEDSVSTIVSEPAVHDRLLAEDVAINRAKRDNTMKAYYNEYEYIFILRYYINTYLKLLKSDWEVNRIKETEEKMRAHLMEVFPYFSRNRYYRTNISIKLRMVIMMQRWIPSFMTNLMVKKLRGRK